MSTSNHENVVVAVVCGGPAPEAAVSRISGRCVAEALRASYERVVVVELDRSVAAVLGDCGADVVVPVLHGPPGEDGCLQGLLEILGLPYVGSAVLASATAMDKVAAKERFRAAGLPLARQVVVDEGETLAGAAERCRAVLGSAVVVKPAGQGSALGVAFADRREELVAALERARAFGGPVLVEERIRGRETTVAVLDRGAGPEALPVIEIRTPAGSWYDYDHRYTEGLSEHVVPAPFGEALTDRLQAIAVAAHRCLGCRDLSRVDFVVPNEGDPTLLEVNTMPGMTPTSLYPDAARAAGLSFEELTRLFVERALTRRRREDIA